MEKFFKKYIITYKLWFYIFRYEKISSLPNKNNLFFLTGYPRSGNSYFKNLLKFLEPELNFSSHLHTVASIKIAQKKNIPVYVIIRNPLESISSWCVMRSHSAKDQIKTLNYCLSEYVSYFKFLNKNRKSLKILVFKEIVKNKESFIDKLNLICLNNNKDLLNKKLNEYVKNKTIEKRQSKMGRRHKLKFSSTPNNQREHEKMKFKILLKKEKEFLIAKKLYNNLIENITD